MKFIISRPRFLRGMRRVVCDACPRDAEHLLTRRRLLVAAAPFAAARRLAAQPLDTTQRAIERGLQFLADSQRADGTFGGGNYSRNAAVCGLCGMAMLANGSTPGRGPYGRHLRRLIDYLLDVAAPSGLIAEPEAATRGPMYQHGFATLFLAEVYGMAMQPTLRQRLSRAVRLIVNTQNEAGGWRYEPRRFEADLSVTVCQLMALRAARNAGLFVTPDTIERAVRYVKRCQNSDGGFTYMVEDGRPSEFPRSAAAIVALYSAGIYEGDEISRGLAYLARYTPRRDRRQQYFMYGHYYAVQAMWHAGPGYWETWYPAIRGVLLGLQQGDGSWFDDPSIVYGTAMACLILQMPRNHLPIFRR